MALTYKVLGQLAPALLTQSTLYTVPSATSTIVNSIVVANTNPSATTFRVAVQPNAEAIALKHYVAYEFPIGGNTTVELALGVTMDAADIISVYSSSGTLSFNAFGVQIV